MKNSKFWIWFIPMFLMISFGIYILISNNTTKHDDISDALKIKEEYEKLNDDNVKVSLSENNVYKYITKEEIKDIFSNKDGLIYFANSKDNVSRKSIAILNTAITQTSIPQVYYYNISDIDNEFNNYLQEKLEVNEIKAGTLVSIEKGRILDIYYPNHINSNEELNDNEKEDLLEKYQSLIKVFTEACDEDC